MWVAVSVAYFAAAHLTDRTDHFWLAVELVVLFAAYFWLAVNLPVLSSGYVRVLLAAGFIYRLLTVTSFPSWSDDVYRFLWDARIGLIGADPFAYTPAMAMQQLPLPEAERLFPLLNNHHSYSTYPPMVQSLSMAAVAVAGGNGFGLEILLLRIPVLISECLSVWLLADLLAHMGRSRRLILLYALNPLVILELTANLHHESYVVLFLLLMLWLIRRGRALPAAVALSLAAGVKLLPLIHLPALIARWPRTTALWMALITGVCTLLLVFPLASAGWDDGLGLYFQRFEFNPSLWAVVREFGRWVVGFNIIGYAGTALALTGAAAILIRSWRTPMSLSQPEGFLPFVRLMAWNLLIYLLCSTTVHPWYVVPLVPLGILAGMRWPLVWSGLITITYFGYTDSGYDHASWIGWTEYGLLALWMWWEHRESPV